MLAFQYSQVWSSLGILYKQKTKTKQNKTKAKKKKKTPPHTLFPIQPKSHIFETSIWITLAHIHVITTAQKIQL